MTWTQPICLRCWELTNPGRTPVRAVDPDATEICCLCGEETRDGIWVRADPRLVPHPRKEAP